MLEVAACHAMFLWPPPTTVCLKEPANIEKCKHWYFSHF